MKEKPDLVRGWVRKAESDLIAMRASAEAGASDAACFHAQQAAEKFLKGYLAHRDCAIPPTHNLLKLIARCAETDPSFLELANVAEILTPFAVEVRYDMDFWPEPDAVAQARDAAEAIREFVSGRLAIPLAGDPERQTGPALAIERVSTDDLRMWNALKANFKWRVDLRTFKYREMCPGFFDRVIEPATVDEFGRLFRESLHTEKLTGRAAEVAFWKNFGQYRGRDRTARGLLEWLSPPFGADRFAQAIEGIARDFTWDSFQRLRASCGQVSGFATPLAFLSFFDPERFPMVDQRIADWWTRRFPKQLQFSRTDDGWIRPNQQSLKAYVSWTSFCRRQAEVLSGLGDHWRARDVEMAVWSDRAAVLPTVRLASNQ
ncbi:MAG: HEPN domain-containing protein [Acidobacteriota bacterium]